MTTFTLAEHTVEFFDCHELGQGGPDVCKMSINGHPITKRALWGQPRPLFFNPTPLVFDGTILVPQKEAQFYVVGIDPESLEVTKLSSGFRYMRLLRVEGTNVEFSMWWDDREIQTISLV